MSSTGLREPGIAPEDVRERIQECRSNGRNRISRGDQAEVFYLEGETPLALKVPYGRGIAAWLRRRMLRKEARIYRKLDHVDGVARCHGLVDGKYLLLEYIKSVPLRRARLLDREKFLDRLQRLIDEIHQAGVAHGDLKTRANIMVAAGERPLIVDFGIAVIRKPGFAPVNHWLFEKFRQFDRNAWIKLKYKGRMDEISPADAEWYHLTRIEKLARRVRELLRRMKYRGT